jgi:hypothetical protein
VRRRCGTCNSSAALRFACSPRRLWLQCGQSWSSCPSWFAGCWALSQPGRRRPGCGPSHPRRPSAPGCQPMLVNVPCYLPVITQRPMLYVHCNSTRTDATNTCLPASITRGSGQKRPSTLNCPRWLACRRRSGTMSPPLGWLTPSHCRSPGSPPGKDKRVRFPVGPFIFCPSPTKAATLTPSRHKRSVAPFFVSQRCLFITSPGKINRQGAAGSSCSTLAKKLSATGDSGSLVDKTICRLHVAFF